MPERDRLGSPHTKHANRHSLALAVDSPFRLRHVKEEANSMGGANATASNSGGYTSLSEYPT